MGNYGNFSGNPKTEWLIDPVNPDRNMKLLEDFTYTDPQGKLWLAPKDAIINGASIPRPLWTAVGSPYTDDYRRASIVHDVACGDKKVSRKDADVMFYYACQAGGCSPSQARILYIGVRIGAWASAKLPSGSFAKSNLLFRKNLDMQTKVESSMLSMLSAMAKETDKLNDSDQIEKMDKIIDNYLATQNTKMLENME